MSITCLTVSDSVVFVAKLKLGIVIANEAPARPVSEARNFLLPSDVLFGAFVIAVVDSKNKIEIFRESQVLILAPGAL